jgi:hypothetical protein
MKKKIVFSFIVLLLLETSFLYSQEFDTNKRLKQDSFHREGISFVNNMPKDTVFLYLNDTLFFLKNNYEDENIAYFQLYSKFTNGNFIPQFILRENLPDGFYCLYNLTREKAKKTKNKETFVVASGEFKDGMKQGPFNFFYTPENPKWTHVYNTIYFQNDTVHGVVIERENDRISYLGEYNMGIMHGFFYYYNNGAPVIILYEDGVAIKSSEFW